mmetsp:Transcript_4453/g.6332  ORF Transcript_4453/g.6332 Transcript_4453/m.6332 type:complete len:95 (+) Transcript_4453:241-525(+)
MAISPTKLTRHSKIVAAVITKAYISGPSIASLAFPVRLTAAMSGFFALGSRFLVEDSAANVSRMDCRSGTKAAIYLPEGEKKGQMSRKRGPLPQ